MSKSKSRAKTAAWAELPAALGLTEGNVKWARRTGFIPPSLEDAERVVLAEAKQGWRLGEAAVARGDVDGDGNVADSARIDWSALRARKASRSAAAAAGRAAKRAAKEGTPTIAAPADEPVAAPENAPEPVVVAAKKTRAPKAKAKTSASPAKAEIRAPDVAKEIRAASAPSEERVVATLTDDARAAAVAPATPDEVTAMNAMARAKYRKALADAERAERLNLREAGGLYAKQHFELYIERTIKSIGRTLNKVPDMVSGGAMGLSDAIEWAKSEVKDHFERAKESIAEADEEQRTPGRKK